MTSRSLAWPMSGMTVLLLPSMYAESYRLCCAMLRTPSL